jgi:protocatechuate 3,4-dioxygenase beta subunit
MTTLYPFLLTLLIACTSQPRPQLGGRCEGCEALLEYGNKKLLPVDTLPDFQTQVPKILVQGTVFRPDGKTPASDIILYLYHTDRQGIYPTKGNEKGWAKNHGYLRGWVKTDRSGQYRFYTVRPAAYPDRSEPEHMHITVKEPGKIPYYLDDYLFLDDPLLNHNRKYKNRGGSGLVHPVPSTTPGLSLVNRDITLGKNIPNYD